MKKSNLKYFLLSAFFVFLLDQATKLWALNFLEYDEKIKLNSIISLHRVFNESTILLDFDINAIGLHVYSFRVLFVLMAVVLTAGVIWVSTRKSMNDGSFVAEFAKTGLFIICGGIWGNAFDRAFRPEGVVDFIRIDINRDLIPIINIADIMIYVGELSIIMGWIFLIINAIYLQFKGKKGEYVKI